jgi:hypothetical protein
LTAEPSTNLEPVNASNAIAVSASSKTPPCSAIAFIFVRAGGMRRERPRVRAIGAREENLRSAAYSQIPLGHRALVLPCRMRLDQALQLPNVAHVVTARQRRGQRCLLHVVIDAGLRRSDVTVVSVAVAYDRCRASVLQASNGFDHLDLQNTKHDPSPRLSSL